MTAESEKTIEDFFAGKPIQLSLFEHIREYIATLGEVPVKISKTQIYFAAGRQFARRRAFMRNSATASGTIVALTENRERDEISYFPRVKFKTPSGREVTFESETGSTADAGRIGDTVTVRYRPDQPYVAEIDSFMSLWGLTLLFGSLGVGFLFVGLGLLVGLLPV